MKNTTHTPGPWVSTDSVTAEAIPHRWICDAGAGNSVVTQNSLNGVALRSQAEHNARLIAAAPELLEACKAIVAILDGRQPKDIPGAIMVAQSAIAKAEGNA